MVWRQLEKRTEAVDAMLVASGGVPGLTCKVDCGGDWLSILHLLSDWRRVSFVTPNVR